MKIKVICPTIIKNPYHEYTRSWNIWIDILCEAQNNETSLEDLCAANNLPEDYYDFSELIEQGMIIVEEE